uniref:Mpv17-like protein n=1 Tax=Trichuris muris TaxID=70415 RepID=A0A5S6QDT1_TRIMR
MASLAKKILKLPGKFFTKHLLVANISSGIVIGFLGDVMQQKIKARREAKLDPGRVDITRARNLSLTTSLLSVEMHFWYKLLDRVFPKASLKHVAIKVCLDEMIMAPNFCLSMLAMVNLLEGSSWEKFTSRLKNSFGIMYLADVVIYTPVQCINFYFLPTRYRTVFVYSASALYLCIASYALHDVKGL